MEKKNDRLSKIKLQPTELNDQKNKFFSSSYNNQFIKSLILNNLNSNVVSSGLTTLSLSQTTLTKQLLSNGKQLVVYSSAEFVSGYFAACTSITLLFPLNKIIFRQILDGISFKEAFSQLRHEGIANIYRGLLPPLLQKSTSYSIMFGSQNEYYLWLNLLYQQSNFTAFKSMNPQHVYFTLTGLSASLAGLTEAILCPFERVQAILQLRKFQDSYKHTLHVFQEISANHGYKELYRGMSAICLRNSLSNALFFTSRNPLKSLFPQTKNGIQNTFYDFVSGGFLGASISTIFYPLNVVKSHMQARIGGNYTSIREEFWYIYKLRNGKFLQLYKGVGSNFTRAIFAWGITNSAYEFALKKLKK